MARNKITDLNNHLFAQLEKLNDEELTDLELSKEVNRTKAITSISSQIIKAQKLRLDAVKLSNSGANHKSDIPEEIN
jgi:hypothetical protein